MMLSLIVKGNRFAAARAAADRRIPAVFVRETKGETILHVGEQFERDVGEWFNADVHGAPYPVGALLAWTYLEKRLQA